MVKIVLNSKFNPGSAGWSQEVINNNEIIQNYAG